MFLLNILTIITHPARQSAQPAQVPAPAQPATAPAQPATAPAQAPAPVTAPDDSDTAKAVAGALAGASGGGGKRGRPSQPVDPYLGLGSLFGMGSNAGRPKRQSSDKSDITDV